jgi:hypothetical protein
MQATKTKVADKKEEQVREPLLDTEEKLDQGPADLESMATGMSSNKNDYDDSESEEELPE